MACPASMLLFAQIRRYNQTHRKHDKLEGAYLCIIMITAVRLFASDTAKQRKEGPIVNDSQARTDGDETTSGHLFLFPGTSTTDCTIRSLLNDEVSILVPPYYLIDDLTFPHKTSTTYWNND